MNTAGPPGLRGPGRGQTRGLWVVTLGPPGAWAAQFLVSYNLADSLGCSPGALGGLQRTGLPASLGAVTGLAALACVASGLLALRLWGRLRTADPSPGERARWMAMAGIMLSAFFLLVILAALLPIAILRPPCASTP